MPLNATNFKGVVLATYESPNNLTQHKTSFSKVPLNATKFRGDFLATYELPNILTQHIRQFPKVPLNVTNFRGSGENQSNVFEKNEFGLRNNKVCQR